MPEDDDKVKAFFDALGELREREGDRLFWVMGVDMAHMGARYHDRFAAVAGEGAMQEVERARRAADRAHQCAGCGRLLGPGARGAGRSEVVRVVAVLYVSEDGSEGARRTAEVRAVEHRREQRGELCGDGLPQGGLTGAERDHRIDARGAAGRDVAGGQRYGDQQQDDAGEGLRVGGPGAE